MVITTKWTLFISSLTFLLISRCSAEMDEENRQEPTDDGNIRLVYRLLDECSRKDDMTVCLKMKTVNFLDRVLKMKEPIPITSYIALAKISSGNQKGENELPKIIDLERSLPRDLNDKTSTLNEMIWERLSALFSSRTIQLTLPGDIFEGRGDDFKKKLKKGKGHGLLYVASMGAMMMKMAMAKIALIAGKALMVAKIALVIAAVTGLKKISGGGEHAQVVYASSHDEGGGWQRRHKGHYQEDEHDLVYHAYHPNNNNINQK